MSVLGPRSRSSHRSCSIKKVVLKIFAKLTGNQLCESLFFEKVACLRPATLLKKKFWFRRFLGNFAKLLRTPFLQNTSRRLLLQINVNLFSTTHHGKLYLVALWATDWLFLNSHPSQITSRRQKKQNSSKVGSNSKWGEASKVWTLERSLNSYLTSQIYDKYTSRQIVDSVENQSYFICEIMVVTIPHFCFIVASNYQQSGALQPIWLLIFSYAEDIMVNS